MVTFPFRVNGMQALLFAILSPAHHWCSSIPFLFLSGPAARACASAHNALTRYHAYARGHDWYWEVKIQHQESQPNFTSCQWDRVHLCYRDAILQVPAKLFVAGDCSVYSSWPLECCWELAVVCRSRLHFSVELTAREGQCLSLTWSWLLDQELFASRLARSRTCVPLIHTALHQYSVRTCIMPFRFRSIPVSLNAIHHCSIRFCLHGTEQNGNVTIFMVPTVHVYSPFMVIVIVFHRSTVILVHSLSWIECVLFLDTLWAYWCRIWIMHCSPFWRNW